MANQIHVKIANAIITELQEKAENFDDQIILEVNGVTYSPSAFTFRDEFTPVLFCGLECPSADIFTFPVSDAEFERIYKDLRGRLLPERVLAIGREVH